MDAEDVEEYRRRAPHYLALAGETSNLAQRAALVDLAALCLRMAYHAERSRRAIEELERCGLAKPHSSAASLFAAAQTRIGAARFCEGVIVYFARGASKRIKSLNRVVAT
jgi:hypothetical protein